LTSIFSALSSLPYTTTHPFRPTQQAGGEPGFYSRPNQHPVYLPEVDIFPIRPHGILYTSDPRVLEMPSPWWCIQSSYPFNHHHPSTPLNGDCVTGIVLLTSEYSRFPIKVTFVTEYDASGLGKLMSLLYYFESSCKHYHLVHRQWLCL
jgi:hypothetical protein